MTALFGLVIALLGYHGHARLGGVTASASKAPVSGTFIKLSTTTPFALFFMHSYVIFSYTILKVGEKQATL